MKRTLLSLMLSVPMLAFAAEQACVPAVPAADPGTEVATTDGEVAVVTVQPADAVEALPCVDTTASLPAPAPEPAYVPKTAHDNSPYRFDMNQNGKRMTAEEFDEWMQAKGIRVATGQPSQTSGYRSATQGTSAANPVTPAPDTKPSPPPREGD